MDEDEYPQPPRRSDYLLLLLRHMLNDMLPENFYLWLRKKTKNTPLEDTFQTEKSLSGRRHRGAWVGNNICLRMVVDLYKILQENSGKHTLSIVDGILGVMG